MAWRRVMEDAFGHATFTSPRPRKIRQFTVLLLIRGRHRFDDTRNFRKHAPLPCRVRIRVRGGIPSARLRTIDAGKWNVPLQATMGREATFTSLVLRITGRFPCRPSVTAGPAAGRLRADKLT